MLNGHEWLEYGHQLFEFLDDRGICFGVSGRFDDRNWTMSSSLFYDNQ
jgi:hypothetical protein